MLENLKGLSRINSSAFQHITTLRVFMIKNCEVLTTGDFDFTESPLLMVISITGTAIEKMKMPLLNAGYDQAGHVELELTGNKLICDCEMQWVKSLAWKESKIDCEKPKKLFRENEITVQDFVHCSSPTTTEIHIFLISSCSLINTFIAILLG